MAETVPKCTQVGHCVWAEKLNFTLLCGKRISIFLIPVNNSTNKPEGKELLNANIDRYFVECAKQLRRTSSK